MKKKLFQFFRNKRQTTIEKNLKDLKKRLIVIFPFEN